MVEAAGLTDIEEYSSPPSGEFVGGDNDKNPNRQILIYGDDETFLRQALSPAHQMVEFGNMRNSHKIDMRYYQDFSLFSDRIETHVMPNPKLLIAIVYVVTQESVNRCLNHCVGVVESVAGVGSSEEFRELMDQEREKKSLETMISPDDWLLSEDDVLGRREMGYRIENTVITTARFSDQLTVVPNKTNGNFVFDRWEDIGRRIIRKFSHPQKLTLHDVSPLGINTQIVDKILSNGGLF